MKIILELAVADEEERAEAREYAAALQRVVERRQWQDMPGALLDQADASVWVSRVTVEE